VKSNLLTSSRLKTARLCKRKHRIMYELGFRPAVEAEELFFGSLLHLALEAWWLGVKAALIPDEWLNRALGALAAVKANPFVLAKAQVMIMGYHARWESEAAYYEVLGVEERFECDVVNPDTGHASTVWRLGGKLDVRVRDRRDGLVKFLEHKSSAEDISPGSVYWRRLQMNSQISVYFDGCEALGTPAASCIYDVLGKPGQRPGTVPLTDEHGNKIVLNAHGERVRTAQGKWRQTGDTVQGFVVQTREETVDEYKARLVDAITSEPARYYARGEVVRLEQEMVDSRADIWAMQRELREAETAKPPRAARNPDGCDSYGRLCPYLDVCCGLASLEDPSRFRQSDVVHPELAEPKAAEAA
jgi:hypothetical protein